MQGLHPPLQVAHSTSAPRPLCLGDLTSCSHRPEEGVAYLDQLKGRLVKTTPPLLLSSYSLGPWGKPPEG